jgi:hypothetical protein
MRFMTEDAIVVCDHQLGNVKGFAPAQSWVTVRNRRVLVEPDPVGRSIAGCPNVPPMGKPCTTTLAVVQGYSALLTIDGRRVCLDTVRGLTDGVAPVNYTVRDPAQQLVDSGT